MNGKSGTPCGMISIFSFGTAYISRRNCAACTLMTNQPIGKPRYLFENHALIWIWIAQNAVQRGYNRHFQFAQKGQDVAARNAAVDPVFMLDADQVVAVEN